MCGSGAAIGMAITTLTAKVIRREHHRALAACIVAGAGAVIRSTAGCRIAAATAALATGAAV